MKRRASITNLFLLELILSITIFGLTASICATFFSKAHILTYNALQLRQAVTCTTNIADIFRTSRSTDDCITRLQRIYPDTIVESDHSLLTLCFDEIGQNVPLDESDFFITVKFSKNDDCSTADLTCESSPDSRTHSASRLQYELTVKHIMDT
jgi:hypothetical protein